MVFIDQPGVESAHQGPSVLDKQLQPVRLTGGELMQRRGDHQFVTGEVVNGACEFHRNVPVVKGAVEQLDVLAQQKMFRRLPGQVESPFVVMRIQNGALGLDPAVFNHGSQQFHLLADLADFTVDPVILLAGVG